MILANVSANTIGELQTPMHYAAKNNATASLKVMLRLGALINERDYKRRTPLFVAAETGIYLFICLFVYLFICLFIIEYYYILSFKTILHNLWQNIIVLL